VARINDIEPRFASLDDSEICRESLSLRYRAGCGEALSALLPEAYALVREASRRTKGMRHYDVQMLGGTIIFGGAVAEMQTGEGKTLTATLPMYLAALAGQGAHLATANDYLAARDAEIMRPVYELLGLSVGVVEASTPRPQRRLAYHADMTYGTAKEFGFDFLRDRLFADDLDDTAPSATLRSMLGQPAVDRQRNVVQRERYFALVDEADSILIDEARTPLIVSSLPGDDDHKRIALYRWASDAAVDLELESDYVYQPKAKQAVLTKTGRRRVRQRLTPEALASVEMFELYQQVECALKVNHEFQRDRDYVVRDGEVVIVDEFTGRTADGRKWRQGIHQAVEAREGLAITTDAGEAARVTIQNFFLGYDQLAGMTGTASTSRRELRRIYSLRVDVIPTHKPSRRERLDDRVFLDAEHKWRAIADRVAELHASGRPVLVGAKSIDRSESLSAELTRQGLPHEVLNAHHLEREATLIAAAGQRGRITVATNMAGRGTDIELGGGVQELGGLHVIGTELHDSARIDRQLIGRCGRQGDPGSYEQFMSLDDEILETGLGPSKAKAVRRQGEALAVRGEEQLLQFAPLFRKAQRRVELAHFRNRKILMQLEQRCQELQRQMGQDPYLEATQ